MCVCVLCLCLCLMGDILNIHYLFCNSFAGGIKYSDIVNSLMHILFGHLNCRLVFEIKRVLILIYSIEVIQSMKLLLYVYIFHMYVYVYLYIIISHMSVHNFTFILK